MYENVHAFLVMLQQNKNRRNVLNEQQQQQQQQQAAALKMCQLNSRRELNNRLKYRTISLLPAKFYAHLSDWNRVNIAFALFHSDVDHFCRKVIFIQRRYVYDGTQLNPIKRFFHSYFT